MMKERKKLQSKYDTNRPRLKQLNKFIIKAIHNDIRTSKFEIITKTFEENNKLRVFRQRLSKGMKEICKMRKKEGKKTNY